MSQPDSRIGYHCDSGLGIIHISDGDGNRLNPQTLTKTQSALTRGLNDKAAKILMIRSGEASFCLGMDLQGLESSLGNSPPGNAPPDNAPAPHHTAQAGEAAKRAGAVALYSELLHSIMTSAKPVIALVEGEAKAGGVGLAAACDIVIGTDNASFELSEVLFGLVPYNVLPYVFAYRMPPQRFRYLVLSAARLDATEAFQFGLIDKIYPASGLEKGLRSILRTMMRAEPHALKAAKGFFAETLADTFTTRRQRAEQALLDHMQQPQVKEGLEAFHAGHTPAWFQRFKPLAPLSGRPAADTSTNKME